MKSIRRYLITSLIAALTAGALLVGAFVYWNATMEINELYDASMEQFANTLQSQLEATSFDEKIALGAVGPSLAAKIVHEQEFLIQIWNKHGQQVYTSHRAIALPLQEQTGLFIAELQGRTWRFYLSKGRHFIIQVAQPQKSRIIFTRQMALKLLLPMLALIPLISLLIWVAVGRSLRPLRTLSQAITKRSAASLEPLADENTPQEVQPVILELNALLLRLKNSLEAQRRFTADAAHELRTPLTVLQLQLGNLKRVKSDDERNKAIERLQSGIDRATRLVLQLLTLARVEPDTAETSFVPVDLAVLGRDLIGQFLDIAHAKNIDLGAPRLEQAVVSGNPGSLRIMLENLIDNAIRYTPAGGKINVLIHRDADKAVICIEDNGIGIAQSDRSRVFERFYRALGTGVEGTGLGLSIVQNIVEHHAGRIHVDTGSNNQGTRFTVELKLRAD